MYLVNSVRRSRHSQHARSRMLFFEIFEDRCLLSLMLEPSWTERGPRSIAHGQVEAMLLPLPNPVIGAIEAIAAHPTNPDIAYVASVGGGIWRTGNATSLVPLWTPLTDGFPSLSMGGMSFDPTDPTANTLVAGIGSFSSGGRVGGAFVGALRTTDGGATWSQITALAGQNIKSIFARGQTILAGTNQGVFLSTDGGLDFCPASAAMAACPLSAVPTPAIATVHLAQDPTNASRFYAGVPGQGMFRTDDSGQTWTGPLNSGLANVGNTVKIETSVGAGGAVFTGLIVDGGQAPFGSSGQLDSVYWSIDQGATWFDMGGPRTPDDDDPDGLHPRSGGQGDVHFSILADRDVASVVYVGGDTQPREDGEFPNSIGCDTFSGRLFRGLAGFTPLLSSWEHITCDPVLVPSTDLAVPPFSFFGGANGTSPHADSRDMVFDANGDILEADDGGIYRLIHRNDSQNRLWLPVNGNLGVTEFYSVAYDPNLDRFTGGTQDVGSVDGDLTSLLWATAPDAQGGRLQGDGGIVDIVSAPGISVNFNSAQNLGQFQRRFFLAGTHLLTDALDLDIGFGNVLNLRGIDPTVQFINPWALNAVDPSRMLIGTQFLYESFNMGETLTPIGGLFQNNVGNVTALVYGGRLNNTDVPDVAWVGANLNVTPGAAAIPNLLLRSTVGGAFNRVTAYTDPPALGGVGGGVPRDIVLDPDDWQTAFVVDRQSVWMTTDAGASWANITGNLNALVTGALPVASSAPVNLWSVEFIPTLGAVVVGTLNGVYATLNPSAPTVQWFRLGPDLLSINVRDVRYDPVDDLLLAGTWGRGVWTLPNATANIPLSGKLVIHGDMDGLDPDDSIRLTLNAVNVTLLDIFVNNAATPLRSVPLNWFSSIEVNALTGNDTVTLDLASGNFLPPGGVVVNGGSELFADRLVINGLSSGAIYEIQSQSVSIAGKLVESQTIEFLELNTSDLSDTVFVLGTSPSFLEVSVDTRAGSDIIQVDSNATAVGGTTRKIESTLTIDGGSNHDLLIVNNEGDSNPNAVTLTETNIFGAGTFFALGGDMGYQNLETLTINTGDVADTINVAGTAAGTDTFIYTGRGEDLITVAGPPDSDAGAGTGPDARVGTVDQVKSLLTIDGQQGSDKLEVIDTSDTSGDIMTLTEVTIGMGPSDTFLGSTSAGIKYLSIAQLDLWMGSGGNQVYIQQTHPDTKTWLKTGEGDDTVLVEGTDGTVNHIRSQLDIDGQGHSVSGDMVTVSDVTEALASTLMLTADQVLGDGTFFGMGGELTYHGLEQLNVKAGVNQDTILVTGTAPGTETAVHGGGGTDLFTIGSGDKVDLVRSPLTIDGGAGAANVLALINSADLTPNHVVITKDQVLEGGSFGTFFGPGGAVSYSYLTQLNLVTGLDKDLINIQSSHPGTKLLVGGGDGDDVFLISSNGLGLGGIVTGIASQVRLIGGPGNNLLGLDHSASPDGAVVTLLPTALFDGTIGNGPADNLFSPGGSVLYEDTLAVGLAASDTAADVIHVTPAMFGGTGFFIAGNSPTLADPTPGDQLFFDLSSVTGATVKLAGLGHGDLTSSNHARVKFENIELVGESSGGGRFDLLVDMSAPLLGGNDGLDDRVEAYVEDQASYGQRTFNLQINGQLAFVAAESAVNSVTLAGTGDPDTLVMVETLAGLPTLAGSSPSGHTNTAFLASALAPTNVGIHFDGGPGLATDQLELAFSTPQAASVFPDMVAAANSGVVNVEGAFTLSYASLTPIRIHGAGGSLLMDATELRAMTELALTALIDGSEQLSGDGGFETTIFSGFDSRVLRLPEGVRVAAEFAADLVGTFSVPGDLDNVTLDGDLVGALIVAGKLGTLRVAGSTPGTITAADIGTISARRATAASPVLKITEGGIERRLEAVLANTGAPPPSSVLFQYFYDSTDPEADPQLAVRVTNGDPATSDDDLSFDLNLVSNAAAEFDLARLEAAGTSGIRNVVVEGDLLATATAAALEFLGRPLESPGGVRLPDDRLGGVAVQDNVEAATVEATSIQAVSFGSLTTTDDEFRNLTIPAEDATADHASRVLSPRTAVVQADGTFLVPFSESQLVALFLAVGDAEAGDNAFEDALKVLFADQVSDDASPTAEVTAAIDEEEGERSTIIETIGLRGAGGSIQTGAFIRTAITSTGPLGDLILTSDRGIVGDVRAPSIQGNIEAADGPIAGTIQTTAGDFGRMLTDDAGKLIGTTRVLAAEGLTGRLISRGDLISRVLVTGRMSGLIAAEGSIGAIQRNSEGTPVLDVEGRLVRVGGIRVDGGLHGGQIVALGNLFGDLQVNGGLKHGSRIAVQGRSVAGLAPARVGMLGNVTIHGNIDADGAIVSGGVIGDAAGGTELSVGNATGILAAKGSIQLRRAGNLKKAAIFQNATGGNAAAIDAIFTHQGQELAFDLDDLDLLGLQLILEDLARLRVDAAGKLVGPVT